MLSFLKILRSLNLLWGILYIGLFQKKTKWGRGWGVENILFWKNPWNFSFFTLPLEFQDETKLHPWKFHTFLLDLLEIPRPKSKTPGWRFHYFFLVTLGNSTSFLINTPGNSSCYFSNTPGNSISSTPMFRFFYGIAYFWILLTG